MNTEVWLIRHGETEWNRLGRIQGMEDIELNDEGIRQAKVVGEALKDFYFTVILASPLKRAFVTAKHIQDANLSAPPLVEDPRLVEWHYGNFSGVTYAERTRILELEGEKGTETMDELSKRAERVLDHLINTYMGERLAVVSHGGFIKTLLVAASQGELNRQDLTIGNCSISKIVYDNRKWNILGYNINDHLGK